MLDRCGPWGLVVVVALAAVAPYVATLGYGLVWDDPALVELVERADREGGLARVASVEFRLDPREPTGYYRPVVLLSLWADRAIGGGSSIAYHATNVVLHAGAALLVAAVIGSLLRSRAAGAAAGVLFGAHPVHVESVAFVAGRTDLWAGVFVLAGTLAWASGRKSGGIRRTALVMGSGGAIALGGLSKESALELPVVLLVLEALVAEDPGRRSWWRRLVPWLAAWAVAVGLVVLARAASGVGLPVAPSTVARIPLLTDPLLLPQIVTKALALFVVPWPLNAFWEREQLAWSLGTVLAAAAGMAVFATAGRWAGWRPAAAGAAWTILFMAPVSGIVPLGSAPFAERFLYLPSAGFCLAAAALVARLQRSRRARAVRVLGLTAVVLLLGAGSVARATVWKDEVSLFESLVRSAPKNAALWDDLGQAYEAVGRTDDAIGAFRTALRLDPKRAGAWNGLGVVSGRQGKLADSAGALREAIRLDPTMPHPRFNLAVLCLSLGDLACAEEQRRALETLAPEAAQRVAQALRRLR